MASESKRRSIPTFNFSKGLGEIEEEHLSEYSSPYISCIPFTYEGKALFVKVVKPDDWDTPEGPRSRKAAINSSNPIFTLESLVAAPNGVYVWIDGNKGFFAMKVKSMFEFGTKHKQLAFITQTEEIYVAGECDLSTNTAGRSVDGNILSGTYTNKIKEAIQEEYENMPKNVQKNELKQNMELILRNINNKFKEVFGESVEIRDEKITKITDAKTPLSLAELEFYKSLGYKVYLYENKARCDAEIGLMGRLAMLERQLTNPLLKDKASKEIETLKEQLAAGFVMLGGGKRRTRRRKRT
jgi:hypothetical protein